MLAIIAADIDTRQRQGLIIMSNTEGQQSRREWFCRHDSPSLHVGDLKIIVPLSPRPQAKASIMKGHDPDGVAETEADHFMKCPGCEQWFDMRDLGQLLAHVHDQDIDIVEGPAPPPREGPVQ
jgi:hypothetical protein